jgi:D-alanyl-D-alanine carboxypeptidase
MLSKLAALSLATLVASTGASTTTTTTTPSPPPAHAELLIDVNNGHVLYAQDAHIPMPPGSLTKILTAMIVADWLPPDAQVPVSAVAANAYPDRLGMKAGQVWPLSVSLQALLVDSANDAAYALAQRVSGSLPAFAATMQQAAAEIGMTDHPVLEDPAGLDGTEGFDGGNRISAWDLAIAARDMMANPALAAIAHTQRVRFKGPDGIVYSLLNKNLYFLRVHPDAIGVKTGYTDAAGFCVIEEAQRSGRQMMAVVLNGTNAYQTAADLLTLGFSTPLANEPANPATLPPIVEPYPPPPATATTTDPFHLAKALPPPSKKVDRSYLPGVIAAVLLVTGIPLTARQIRQQRRAAHRRR